MFLRIQLVQLLAENEVTTWRVRAGKDFLCFLQLTSGEFPCTLSPATLPRPPPLQQELFAGFDNCNEDDIHITLERIQTPQYLTLLHNLAIFAITVLTNLKLQ